MKKIVLLLCFVFVHLAYSQKEANIWYFGENAGLDFSAGEPIAITDGQLNTKEGCASIADENGSLLFYTDGNKVYNKNHVLMSNGSGLHGNSSSTQSAIVVPKPNSNSKYYIFTVDEHNSNIYGLQYSIVDMSLNSGLGDITSEKNISLLSHSTEKIAAVKSGDCGSIYVIAFSSPNGIARNYNTFHVFKVTDVGIESSITSSFSSYNEGDGRGYLKISADGTKIVVAHSIRTGQVYLYDFDVSLGLVSNEQQVFLNDISHPNNNTITVPYGVEFSLDTSKLYITSIASGNAFNELPQHGFLWQYDLNGISNNASLISYNPTTTYRGALQMGPNGKIYRALPKHYELGSNFLGVINNPNASGLACNYVHNGIALGAGTLSTQGLPPFIQSLLLPDIDIVNDGSGTLIDQLDLCDGETYLIGPDTSSFPTTTIYEWTKDGVSLGLANDTASILIDGVTYGTGNYKVFIDYNDGISCPFYGKVEIDYHDKPVLNTPITIRQCDDDTDGYAAIDLALANESISANSANETFTYHTSQTHAQNGTSPIDISNFITNSTATPIWVRVDTGYCHTIGEVNIIVSTAAVDSFQRELYKCDDYIENVSTETDGFAMFDLTLVEEDLKAEFPLAQRPNLHFSYYRSLDDAQLPENPISTPSTYRNVTATTSTPERIYIRVSNNSNTDCVGLGVNLYVDLFVETLPIANSIPDLKVCETVPNSNEGEFDTTEIPNIVLQGQTGVTLSYYEEDNTPIQTSDFIKIDYTSSSKNIIVRATNNTTNDPDGACYDETVVRLLVSDLPFVVNNHIVRYLCDDLPDQNDNMSVFDTSDIEVALLGEALPSNMEIHYYSNGIELVGGLPKYFNTSTQTIDVTINNRDNSSCEATATIDFEIIVDNPKFDDIPDQVLCINLLPDTPLVIEIQNPQDSNYTYVWEDEFNIIPSISLEPAKLEITKEGTYSVTATSVSLCTTTKTFTITESSIPKIEKITIFDDLPNNRISVKVSGIGDYEYALDTPIDYVEGNKFGGHIFYDIDEGKHTIYVNDKNGCLIASEEVVIIRFPKYISPNGDQIHDYFYIYGGDDLLTSKVTIFNRFGKIVALLKNNEKWNGYYQGKIVPATEYWFLAELKDANGMIYKRKGHFSLKL